MKCRLEEVMQKECQFCLEADRMLTWTLKMPTTPLPPLLVFHTCTVRTLSDISQQMQEFPCLPDMA